MTEIHKDWNPDLYLKFEKERTQPSIDLVSRISVVKPEKIIDIGCGPGNSTQILVRKWPDARVTGIDNSPAMIDKAKKDYPDQDWRIMDAGKDEMDERFDIVFSNATIQWIPNHAELLKRFYNLLAEDGALAIQIPMFWEMPLGKAIIRISQGRRWKSITTGVAELITIHDCAYYYNHLSNMFRSVEMWESSYMHILDSALSVLEMIKSTGLRPYLDRLSSNSEKEEFENEVLQEIAIDYPIQKNNKVIFPFRRLFFIAYK